MERTTVKQLENVITQINRLTHSPIASYTKTSTGILPNAGNFHLNGSYNGRMGLARMLESGGIELIIPSSTKRELYDRLQSFIAGFRCTEETNERDVHKPTAEPAQGPTPGPWAVQPSSNPKNGTGWRDIVSLGQEFTPSYVGEALERDAPLIAAAHKLLLIAKAYRNLLRTMASTEEDLQTYHDIDQIIREAEGGS